MAHEGYHLVCVHPFHGYKRGQEVSDPMEVAKLLQDKEHHFVRINAPQPIALAEPAEEEVADKSLSFYKDQ